MDDLKRPDLLPQRIAELLREAILDGRLPPGTRLIEQKLAEQWQISRAPLREAIRQIASEGLVTLSPRRGASVSEVSKDGLAELFAVRGMMEVFAARLAAGRATPAHIELMRGLVSAMESSFQRKDLAAFYAAGLEFHNVLIVSAGNDMLARMYDQAKQQFRRYQAAMPRLPHLQEDSIEEHRRILKAIERADPDAASAASEDHIRHLTVRFITAR
ncbi:GntR family transcriptional regulator [Caballeronia sp. 15711]|uniref:GntR family transcriptional regulator n=1 Tax=Caballeronia sp. 15711 TaxID=3391029 RepID=UPI0039E71B9A